SRTSLSISELIFTLLTLQPFDFLAAAVYLSLIPIYLLLLLIVGVLLSLELVADQGTGAKPKATANGCAYAGMTYRSADQTTRRRPAGGADAGTFLRCGQ